LEAGKKEQNRISIESKVDNLSVTVEIFNWPLQFRGKKKNDGPFLETRIQDPVANRL